jgi:hypothetical protein
MTELDPFIAKYASKIDGVIKTRIGEDLRNEIDVIFDKADDAFRELGYEIAPSFPYLFPARPVEDRVRSRTNAALIPLRTMMDECGSLVERYRIVPGDFGPIPERLERGQTYKLHGFVVSNTCTIGTALQYRQSSDTAIGFTQTDDLRFFDGEAVRYEGSGESSCDTCQTPLTPFDAFTLLRPNGTDAYSKDGWPQTFVALRGMVAVVEEITA